MDITVSVVNRNDESVQRVACNSERVVVGRGPESDVRLESPAISREHVIIDGGDRGEVFVTDVSANGCWINGERAPRGRRIPLGEDDGIELPGFELRIRRAAVEADLPALAAAGANGAGVLAAPPKAGALARATAPAARLLRSFTGMERFVALLALCSLGLVLVYAFA